MKKIVFVLAGAFILSLPAHPGLAQENKNPAWTQQVEKITGLKGTYNEKENVFKVASPRTDVKVTVEQIPVAPFMGLTSWAAFTKSSKNKMMVMGDLVLFQDEVNTVMSVALDNGLQVTALHNHFFFDEPKVFFMHISGEGRMEQLAAGVRCILDKVKEIRSVNADPINTFGTGSIAEPSSITPPTIEDILGVKGESKDGMFKVTIGSKSKMACGCEVGKAMGVNTWAVFAGRDEKAIVDGDFVVHEDKLQGVLKSLRHSGINVVAIHNHMTQENPRLLFLHYWGIGSTSDLAKALKAALKKSETR